MVRWAANKCYKETNKQINKAGILLNSFLSDLKFKEDHQSQEETFSYEEH